MSTLLLAMAALATAQGPTPVDWPARLQEKAAAVNAAVDAMAPSLAAGGKRAPSKEQAARLTAAWNALMDATEEAGRSFEAQGDTSLQAGLAHWSERLRERPDQPLFRLPTSGPSAVQSARVLAANTLRARQHELESEAGFGLYAIEGAGFSMDAAPAPGHQLEPCPDGSRAQAPDDSWSPGCRFAFRVEKKEGSEPAAVARGVVGPVAGVEYRLTRARPIERVSGPPIDPLPFPAQVLKDGPVLPPALTGAKLRPMYPFAEGMTRPKKLSGRDPVYTHEALAARVEGLFIVRCFVLVEGTLSNCRIIKPLPFMEKAILDALATRRYTPVTYEGKPVDCDYIFNIKLVMPPIPAPGP